MASRSITILDGPLGTELHARGVSTDLPTWSAAAIESNPAAIEAIHRDYADAGATIHTANTFRTQRRTVGEDWESLTRRAVALTQNAVGQAGRVAGSIAPLMDCYRPDLSPGTAARKEHRELAALLMETGCDLLLCETFPHADEAIVAVEEAIRTGCETWIAFTAGPDANLMTPKEMATSAQRAVAAGAAAVLVNCTPASQTLPFVRDLADQSLNVPIGAYANAGRADAVIGWQSASDASVEAYVAFAETWIEAGATMIGGCCGTGPAHIRGLAKL